MNTIKQAIPTALFVHIIRDGRDVTLSLEKLGWIRPLPWDRKRSSLVAGIWWEWLVTRGMAAGRRLRGDYFEVRFEDLITMPRETLRRIGSFIGEDLNYDEIQESGIGSLAQPNTSFGEEGTTFNPVGRWRSKFPPDRLLALERIIGRTLKELDYELSGPQAEGPPDFHERMLRARYRGYFAAKHCVKDNTPLARYFADKNLERP